MRLDDRVLLVDKSQGITSFGAVRTLRRMARLQKVGHCGSLDPLATGLLILCTGVATRVASVFVDLPKEYQARVGFGRATDSYDADGRTTREGAIPVLDAALVASALRGFEGEIDQRPPMVSAVKVQGRRLYELARAGREIERVARKVMVYEIVLLELGPAHADIRVRCGRGCYVRSIAHELGERLGVPAHLESLRRVAIGASRVEHAVTLEQVQAALAPDAAPAARAAVTAAVSPLSEALGFLPALSLQPGFEAAVRNGVQPVPHALRAMPRQPGPHRLVSDDGRRLLGLVEVEGRGTVGAMRLMLVFPAPLEVAAARAEASSKVFPNFPHVLPQDAAFPVVTVGVFDGMHRGHQRILETALQVAHGSPVAVVTFDPHPRAVLGPAKRSRLLSPLPERLELLSTWPVAAVAVLRFDQEVTRRSYRDFVRDTLLVGLGARHLVLGYNMRLGHERQGTPERLTELGRELGFELTLVPAVEVEGLVVSSTAIRHALDGGAVEVATQLLGRPYALGGTVVRGAGRGRALGIPTANLDVGPEKLVPESGVYAVRVQVGDRVLPGALNIGVVPTFQDDGQRSVEVYVLDWDGDLYGTRLRVEFLRRLREERRFDGPAALLAQVRLDVLAARRCFEADRDR